MQTYMENGRFAYTFEFGHKVFHGQGFDSEVAARETGTTHLREVVQSRHDFQYRATEIIVGDNGLSTVTELRWGYRCLKCGDFIEDNPFDGMKKVLANNSNCQ